MTSNGTELAYISDEKTELVNRKLISDSGNGLERRTTATENGKVRRERNELKLEHFYPNCVKPDPNSVLGKRLDYIYSSRYGKWLRSRGLRPSWEVPIDALEIHIWHGYRPNPTSLLYCFKSAFIPSNEMLNVWTHLLPCVLMLWRAYHTYTTLSEPTDIVYWPLWINFFGAIYMFLASSCAHLFSCRSPFVQEFCFCVDYSAISCYGLTTFIANLLYVYPLRCFFHRSMSVEVVLWTSCILAITVHATSCLSRWEKCPSRFTVRYLPPVICYTIAMSPVLVRCWRIIAGTNHVTSDAICSRDDNGFLELSGFCVLMLNLAVLMVITRFPEKYYPGTFDIVGHSHQLFHTFSAAAILSQHSTVERALEELLQSDIKRFSMTNALSITRWTTLYILVFYYISSLFVLYKFGFFLGQEFKRRRESRVE